MHLQPKTFLTALWTKIRETNFFCKKPAKHLEFHFYFPIFATDKDDVLFFFFSFHK